MRTWKIKSVSNWRNIIKRGWDKKIDNPGGLVEKIGSGLVRINEIMDEYLLPHTVIEATDTYFSISFTRPDLQKMSIEQRINKYKRVAERVAEKEELIISLIKENKDITFNKIVENIKISRKTVDIYIRRLKKKGIIKRVGSNRNGYWEVIENIV